MPKKRDLKVPTYLPTYRLRTIEGEVSETVWTDGTAEFYLMYQVLNLVLIKYCPFKSRHDIDLSFFSKLFIHSSEDTFSVKAEHLTADSEARDLCRIDFKALV